MYKINCYDSYGNSINYLTQWDYNRKLIMYIYDYDLSIAPEVHFCNKNSEEALVVQSTVSDDNKITVDIPNILLQEPYSLFAYIYLTDSKNVSIQKTILSVEIPVRKRLKPSEYSYVENIDKVTSAKIEENIYDKVKDNLLMIKTAEQTIKAEDNDGVNVYTITLTDGTVSSFEVKNGSDYVLTNNDKKDIAELIEVPNKTSQLENDSEFITNTVNNLANYYLKSQTYTQDEINAKLSAIPKFAIQVVDSLPISNISNTTVYLLKSSDKTDNLYTEYIYVNNVWECLGGQYVELSGYALKTDIPTKLSDLTNDAGFITNTVSNLVNYYTKTESDNKYQPKGDYTTKTEFNQLSEEIDDYMAGERIVREAIPMVSFTDDDGQTAVLTVLKPLSERYGIPFTIAVITDTIADSVTAHMNLPDLLELQDMGWEIASHTKSHRNLRDLSDAEAEEEIGGSKEILESLGFNVNAIFYPYSGVNENTYKIARKYYKCGRQTDYKEYMNESPLETWDMRVTPIHSQSGTSALSGLAVNSLAYYKWMVDRAVANNAWLIFITHAWDMTDADKTNLEETIKYVQSLNVPIVTISEGLKKRGNIVDSGRYNRQTLYTSEYFVVGCDSKVRQSDNDKFVVKLDANAVTASSPITDFPRYALSFCRITGTSGGFPKQTSLGGGTLITNTMGYNHDHYTEGRAWQEFILPNGTTTYKRYCVSGTEWSDWVDTTTSPTLSEAEKQELIAEIVAIVGSGNSGDEEEVIINLVPVSTDADGNVFNTTGYQDGKRFSSSGSLKDQSGSTATGFISCTTGDVICLDGVKWGTTSSADDNYGGGYCYLMVYTSKTATATAISGDTFFSGTTYGLKVTYETDANGKPDVTKTTFDFSGWTGTAPAYIRISGMGNGSDMVVTKNQDIFAD